MPTLPNPFFAGDEPSPAETAVASLSLPGLGDATADRFVLNEREFMAAIEPIRVAIARH